MRQIEVAVPSAESRRHFLRSVSFAATTASIFCATRGAHAALVGDHGPASGGNAVDAALDEKRMRELAAFTALTLQTPHPVPYGAEIVHTANGERLVRATNAVGEEHDPSG